MENNERDRKLDQWLDEALSEYGAAEPRFGLEQRVLNRIRSEEQRSRKWNVWRWMPAFGAIAALIVVTIAVGPMLEKKVPVRQMSSQNETYSRPAAETAKSSDTELAAKKAEVVTKPADQADLNDTLRGTSAARREAARVPQKEIAPNEGDRDRLITSQQVQLENRSQEMRHFEKKEPASSDSGVSVNGTITAMAPPPPPPPPVQQVGPGVAGGIAGGTFANAPATAATTAPVNANRVAAKPNDETAEAQAAPPALMNDKVASESVASVIAKDSRRKEAHTKPEAPLQDANTIEAFGVTVRFQTGPATQQFPTPVPLSNQEKLALKAGQQLKDSAVAAHKSTEITPIEIKDVEIKPLEGPEKEK